jgi:hypothetical protein
MAVIADLWDPKLAVEGDERQACGHVLSAVQEPLMVCLAVAAYKRRLGGGATAAQLRQDKRLARQVGYMMFLIAHKAGLEADWQELGMEVSDLHRQAAAVVRWSDWLPQLSERLRQEAVWCATWIMKINLKPVVLKSILFRLDEASTRLVRIADEL